MEWEETRNVRTLILSMLSDWIWMSKMTNRADVLLNSSWVALFYSFFSLSSFGFFSAPLNLNILFSTDLCLVVESTSITNGSSVIKKMKKKREHIFVCQLWTNVPFKKGYPFVMVNGSEWWVLQVASLLGSCCSVLFKC